jgi:chromosome segregation ATPase
MTTHGSVAKSMRERIEKLTDERDALRIDLQTADDQLRALRAEVAKRVPQYEDVAALRAEVDALMDDVQSTGKLWGEAVARAVKAEAEVQRLRTQVENLLHHMTSEEATAEVERLRAELLCRDALIKDHLAKILHLENRVDAKAHRADKAEAALRLALDALTDAEQYHGRACAKDQPHDHALLRKLRATIPTCDAALRDTAPAEEPAAPATFQCSDCGGSDYTVPCSAPAEEEK